jgi:hypothetical protein
MLRSLLTGSISARHVPMHSHARYTPTLSAILADPSCNHNLRAFFESWQTNQDKFDDVGDTPWPLRLPRIATTSRAQTGAARCGEGLGKTNERRFECVSACCDSRAMFAFCVNKWLAQKNTEAIWREMPPRSRGRSRGCWREELMWRR